MMNKKTTRQRNYSSFSIHHSAFLLILLLFLPSCRDAAPSPAGAPSTPSAPATVDKAPSAPDPIATLEHQARLFPENETIRRRLVEAYEEANRLDEALRIAGRLAEPIPANAALEIRLLLKTAPDTDQREASRRLDRIERRARGAGVSIPEIIASSDITVEYLALLETAGRREEALRMRRDLFQRAPSRGQAERILALLVDLDSTEAPAFAISNNLPLPADDRRPRRWIDHPDPRVIHDVLARLGDSRTPAEEERFIELRIARGETEAALASLLALATRTAAPRLALKGYELAHGRSPAMEERFIALLPKSALDALPLAALERSLESARTRQANDDVLLWTRRIAARQPDSIAAQVAWFQIAKEAGRDETSAIVAVWRIARNEPWMLKERWSRHGTVPKATLLREYLGPLDPEIAVWFLEDAIAKGTIHQFLPLAEAVGKETLERRADLVDSTAQGLLKAHLFDEFIRLDAFITIRDSIRREVAMALVEAGRYEDAIRFGNTLPGVAVRAALVRGDTPAAVKIAEKAFGGGRLDRFTVELILRHSSASGLRRLVALHGRIRGISKMTIEETGFSFLPARLLLPAAPVERARLYWEWGVPARTAALLKGNPRADPALLVRAALRIEDTSTAASHLAAALQQESRAIDLHLLAYRLAADRGDSNRMILHLEAIDKNASAEDRPHLTAVLANLATLYAEKGVRSLPDRAAALAWFEKAAAHDPRSAIVHYNIGLLYSQSGQTDSALASIEMAVASAPNDVDALILLASLLKKKERHADAATAYRKAIDAGAPIKARHELALLLKSLGEIQGAYVAAAEAYRLMPGDAELARTYGVIAAQISRWRDAVDPLRQAVRAYPGDAEARMYLAHTFLECGRSGEAKAVIAPHPDATIRTEILARAEMAEGKPERAVELLRASAHGSGQTELLTRAMALAADAALSRGHVGTAQRYWAEWLRVDPKADVPRALIAATRGTAPVRPAESAAPETTAAMAAVKTPVESRPVAAPTARTTRTETSPVPAASRSGALETMPRLTLRDAAASLRDGDNVRAEAAARQVLSRRRDDVEALNLLGIALGRQGRRDAAITALEESLAHNPNQPEVRATIQELKQP